VAKITPGNGASKFPVHQQDMGGWVRVFAGKTANVPPDLPVYLSHALTAWLRQRPQLRLRTVVPITRDGDTIELHAWYDLYVIPEIAGHAPGGPAVPGPG
jgi:hypothetical protein